MKTFTAASRRLLGSALAMFALACGGPMPTAALHVLPGGTGDSSDTDFFAMPFPSDVRLKQGAFDLARVPRTIGQPGKYVELIDGAIQGAGMSAGIYFRFAAPLDVASLPSDVDARGSVRESASVYVVDVTVGSPTYGQRHPVLVSFHAEAGQYIGPNWMCVRPVPGLPLREGTTYAAVATRRLRGVGGESVSAGADLTRLLDDAQPSDEPYRSAWTRYAALRAYLKGAGTSSDVVQATVFTTQKATGVMGALRDAVYAQTATPRPLDLGYLRDHDGLVDVYAGRFESPNFQLGDPPYFDGGGGLKLDDSGKPKVSRMESLRFALTVPRGEMPADGWPVILYAHGTGGDYLTFVRENLDTRAGFVELPDGKTVRMAMISIDQVLHGPRDPQRSDPELSFFNMQNLVAARDNVKQGAADDFQLLRLVENFAVEKAPGSGRPIRFDKKRIYFVGHSQGGLTGPLFLAAEPKVQAAVLSGAGSVLILSLLNKRAPVDIAALVEGLLMEPATEDHPLLSMLQAYFESSDPNNYGPLIMKRPPAGSAPKHVLQTLGIGDNYTPVPNIAAFSLSLGVQPIGQRLYNIPGLEVTEQTWGMPPVQNNVATAAGQATGVLRQYMHAPDDDGHFVIFDLWAARHDWTRFLATHVRTGVATLP